MAFETPYVHDFITNLCMRQVEVVQNHDNANFRITRTRRSHTQNK